MRSIRRRLSGRLKEIRKRPRWALGMLSVVGKESIMLHQLGFKYER